MSSLSRQPEVCCTCVCTVLFQAGMFMIRLTEPHCENDISEYLNCALRTSDLNRRIASTGKSA